MNWHAGNTLEYQNETWGQKDIEFQRFITLPEVVPQVNLAAAVNETATTTFPAEEVSSHAWKVLDPTSCVPDWKTYRSLIQQSIGEFSVAKETYVKANTGWFSCRSACYLASGRPVVTQDTGWSRYLPSGEGLLSFTSLEEAAEALRSVQAEPQKHASRARAVAEEYFDSNVILRNILKKIGV